MNAKILIDIPTLYKRIEELSKICLKPDASSAPMFDAPPEDETVKNIKNLIRYIARTVQLQDPAIWKKYDIEFMGQNAFEKCYTRISKKKSTKLLGSGYFGSVYDVVSDPCIKHVPKHVKHVGIKIEPIKPSYDNNQEPERIGEVFQIYKKAFKLGICPELYNIFITKDANGSIQIIKIFEIIQGTNWNGINWSDGLDKQKAIEQLQSKIQKMNKAGIVHHDLHDGNVMVTPEGDVYIIDFDRAKFVKNEEKDRLEIFNGSIDSIWEPKGIASRAGVDFLYNELLNEGSIALLSKPVAKKSKASKTMKTMKTMKTSKALKKSKKSMKSVKTKTKKKRT